MTGVVLEPVTLTRTVPGPVAGMVVGATVLVLVVGVVLVVVVLVVLVVLVVVVVSAAMVGGVVVGAVVGARVDSAEVGGAGCAALTGVSVVAAAAGTIRHLNDRDEILVHRYAFPLRRVTTMASRLARHAGSDDVAFLVLGALVDFVAATACDDQVPTTMSAMSPVNSRWRRACPCLAMRPVSRCVLDFASVISRIFR